MKANLKAPIVLLLSWLVFATYNTMAEATQPQTPTNSNSNMLLERISKNYLTKSRKDPETEFWPAVSDSIENRAKNIVSDRIGFVAQMRLSIKLTELRHDYIQYYSDTGADAVSDGVRDGLREVLAERIPVHEWEEGGKTLFERHIGQFLRGSIGNTEEERLDVVSAEPQSRSLDRSWWKNIREDNNGLLAYGIKPIRTDPYIYATIGFGNVEKRPVILDIRVYSMLLDDQVGNPKVKIGMIVPTSLNSHIILGCSIFPIDMGLSDDKSRGSLRYERVIFRNHRRTTFWSAGIEANKEATLASVMVTSTW